MLCPVKFDQAQRAQMAYRNNQSLRRHRKRAERRARLAAAGLSWLDRPPRWHNDAPAWDGPAGLLRRTPPDLELAAARLDLLARQPAALLQAIGLGPADLERRQARLADARALAAIAPAPDLPALADAARAGDRAAIELLAGLLPAEALCRHGPLVSPAHALHACGPAAEPALRTVLADADQPLPARALAALVLGALGVGAIDLRPAEAGLIRRAYGLGRAEGIPAEPALALAILADPAGPALLARITAAARAAGPLALPATQLRDLHDAGVNAAELAALAESVLAIVPLLERLRPPLEGSRRGQRARTRAARRYSNFVGHLAPTVHTYLRTSRDPEIVQLMLGLLDRLLALTEVGSYEQNGVASLASPSDVILDPLNSGLRLPGPLMRPYLELLRDVSEQIWPADLAAIADRARRIQQVHARWMQLGTGLAGLLRRCGSLDVVRRAFERRLVGPLLGAKLADPALYRWVLELSNAFGAQANEAIRVLMRLLGPLPNRRAARAALGPILKAVLAAPVELRAGLLEVVNYGLPEQAGPLARQLTVLAHYIPALTAAAGTTIPEWYWAFAPALVLLDRLNPAGAVDLIAGLLPGLMADLRRKYSGEGHDLRLAALLAAAVAPADPAAFVTALRAGLGREVTSDIVLSRGIYAVANLPGLATVIARLLPEQPRRIFALIEQIGRARLLGPQALAPLAELPALAAGELLAPALRSGQPGWRELLALAPEIEADAAGYLHAQWLRGGEMCLPRGAGKALDRPARLAAEAAYLEQRLGEEPARPDLAARLANLRAYIAAPDIWARAGREAAEQLSHAAALARLAAAEELLAAGLRARLVAVAGPLAAGARLDDDLLNALLLLSDVSCGRDLLVGLIRAHLSGDKGWRASLPANAAFLADLRERGVDPETWLGAWPASYPLAGVTGGRTTIALETRPLRVLQMGNFFDTCLSLGGINSFSAVANAVDLNKRVLYATDKAGHVIGRKLVGISAEGKLLGYHTYTRIGDPTADGQLSELIRRYLIDFAARCGLELADAGSVPTLVATNWYDDGEDAWGELPSTEENTGGSKTHPHQQAAQLPPAPSAR